MAQIRKIVKMWPKNHDLENRIIRHVDNDSFAEDPLRVLRGAQFAARFNFGVAEETIELCRRMDLSTLARERVMGELEKALLKADRPSLFFEAVALSMGRVRVGSSSERPGWKRSFFTCISSQVSSMGIKVAS